MTYQAIFDRLWQQYSTEIKAAGDIYRLFSEQGETVINDHIALRTFNDPRVGVDVLAQAFLKAGYIEKGQYDFPNKHLNAKHYEHPDGLAPKVFISELVCEAFSPWLQDTVKSLVDQISPATLADSEQLLFSLTPWGPLSYDVYKKLLAESQYAAWMYAYGYRANHFTIFVNHLTQFPEIKDVNNFLKQHGYTLNSAEGEIKGTPEQLLEQSSIMAEKQQVAFEEGMFEIPSCYYEFAKRYPTAEGELYQGFIAASADKIFESTHTD